jgi:hypothetical protein
VTVVSSAPQIAVDLPATNVVYAGRTAVFSVTAYGTLPFSYQWYMNGSPLSDTSRITGSHTNTLMIANCTTNDQATYQLQITNIQSAGTPTLSVPCWLLVQDVPQFNGTGLGWTIQQSGGSGTRGISGNVFTLTDGTGSETTSSFYNYPLYVGAFTASFIYQDVGGVGAEADGVAFVLQNDARGAAALGGGGGGLGLLGITNSAALTLNLYSSASGGTGMSFGTNGAQGLPYSSVSPVALNMGDPINVSVVYDGSNLSVVLTDAVAHTTFTTNIIADLPAIVGANTAYVGITGADGGTVSTQTVSDFSFIPLPRLSAQLASPTTVLLSWPASIGGYALLQRASVDSGTWAACPAVVNKVGEDYQAVVSTSSAQFYRLVLISVEP